MQTANSITAALTEKPQQNTSNAYSKSLTASLESKYSDKLIKGSTGKVMILFSQFKEEYGDLFEYKKDRFTAARAREWAVELLESGINQEQFQHGSYQAVYRQKYPIERSFEFIELCKQVGPSYPAAHDAFVIACSNCGMRGEVKRDWKHDVVLETANRIGWGRLASASEVYFKSFKTAYDQVCSEHANGKSFVIPVSHQLEAQAHSPVKPTDAYNATINQFFAEYGSQSIKQKQGSEQWV